MKTAESFSETIDFGNLERSTSRTRDTLRLEEKQEVINSLGNKLISITGGIKLELQTTGSLGAKDSAHDVFFARTATKDRQGKRQVFACKRFRREESAERELRGLQTAHERGFRTLEPQGKGIYSVDSIGHILVTKHIPRFTTMNQVGWQDHFAAEEEYESKIVPAMQGIASFVGRMHRKGIIHDDLQLKNIGQVPPIDFVLFDLEGASFFEPVTESSPPTFDHASKTTHDVATLVNSLVDRGFLWNSTDEVFANELTDNLFIPYLEEANMHDENVIETFDHIINYAQGRRQEVHGKFSRAIHAA